MLWPQLLHSIGPFREGLMSGSMCHSRLAQKGNTDMQGHQQQVFTPYGQEPYTIVIVLATLAGNENHIFFPRVRTPCGHGAQVIVEGRESQSDGGEKTRTTNNKKQQNTKPKRPTGRVSTIM